MKTRIISGAVGVLVFAAAVVLGTDILFPAYPAVLVTAVALLAAIGAYEILHNTGCVKNNIIMAVGVASSCVQTVIFAVFPAEVLLCAYAIYIALLLVLSLFMSDKTSPSELSFAQAYPIFLSLGFGSIIRILSGWGLVCFFLIFVFAWISDTCAYFTGVFFGKHKLCPKLSPKKTIEGAIGGIAGCVAVTAIIKFTAGNDLSAAVIPMAALFSAVGMAGDISASYIKRAAGIKDYGNIMPGHGGVLDRFDSVLLIAPIFWAALHLLPLGGASL